jgi:hypothetical protein
MMKPWRVGKHYQIHVYEGDTPVCTALTPEFAAQIVADHNARLAGPNAGDVLSAVVAALPAEGEFDTSEIVEAVDAPRKEIYNALGYLTRRKRITRLAYGRYQVGAGVSA